MVDKLANTKTEWENLKRQLLRDFPELEADDQALYDTLDGATELFEAISTVVRSAEDDRMLVSALENRIEEMVKRAARLHNRYELKRAAAAKVMEECGVKKVTAPDFTVSLAVGQPKVVITDEKVLPGEVMVQPPARPSKTIIADLIMAGKVVPGAELANPQPHLVVRRG